MGGGGDGGGEGEGEKGEKYVACEFGTCAVFEAAGGEVGLVEGVG